MIRQIILITILTAGYLSLPVLAVGQGPASYRFLREPAVKWSNERLKGEVRNVPVKNLITELLQKTDTKGTNWEVVGNLEGSISISFDNLTIDESIKKIMRLNRFNYTLIYDEHRLRNKNNFHDIKELAIYQNDQTVKFYRSAKQYPAKKTIRPRRPSTSVAHKPVARQTQPPPAAKSKSRNKPRPEPIKEEFEAIDRELKITADELLDEKIITQEEYDALIEEIQAEKKE